MALIRTSALITDITGRIGGSTFQRTQGGLIMRPQRAKSRNTSNLVQYNKVGMSTITNAWTGLTQAQRDQWNQYAIWRNIKMSKNPTRTISGHQIFIRENSLRYSMKDYGAIFFNPIHNTPLLASPPAPINLEDILNIVLNLILQIDTNLIAAQQACLVWMSAPITQSIQSRYVKRTMIKAVTVDGASHNITDYYTSVYGRIPNVGEYVSVEIGIYDNNVKTYTRNSPQLIKVIL